MAQRYKKKINALRPFNVQTCRVECLHVERCLRYSCLAVVVVPGVLGVSISASKIPIERIKHINIAEACLPDQNNVTHRRIAGTKKKATRCRTITVTAFDSLNFERGKNKR